MSYGSNILSCPVLTLGYVRVGIDVWACPLCSRQGFGALKTYIENYTEPRKSRRKVGVYLDTDVHANLSKAAEGQGVSASQLASKVLAEFLHQGDS